MALLLVHIQNLPDLAGKRRVYLGKAVGTIFVYGAFADAKLSGSLTHGCVFFNDIAGNLYGTLLDLLFQG